MNTTITYAGINKVVETDKASQSLLVTSINHQIPHLHECGGRGRCTTCRVRILEGAKHLSPKTKIERETSFARKWDPSIRLACQTYPRGSVKLQRLVWTMGEVNQLQKELAPEGKAEERAIAILFCDLRNFTSLSSKNLNFDIAYMLNRFYTALGDPILMNNGIIYQYVGDEIIGVFGTAGGSAEKNCTDAMRAALGMQYALDRLNKIELKDFQIKLRSGIGINFGKAYVGHLGHPTHRQFSVIGDPVNVASRIQGQTKNTQTKILISKFVQETLSENNLLIGGRFQVHLAGKEEQVELYELLGFKEMDLQLELQASLHILLEDEDKFAAIFYEKVFELAPAVRKLFQKSMVNQGRLLTHMLGGIVYSLARPEHLMKGLSYLGKNHQRYGVQPAHYPVVKQAMLHTIQVMLDKDERSQALKAWSTALDFVIDAMQNWKQLG